MAVFDWIFSNIVVFIFALGILVFFHELGHFVAAKACGIYCDRFSLGMPPRVWGIRLGETDYCIGALPIGGFVKMAGQEDAPRPEEVQQAEYAHVPPDRWFNNKPVWQRAIVIVAGPLMNVVLAAVLYGIVAGVGQHVPESRLSGRIGLVMEDSPAKNAPLYQVNGTAETTRTAGDPDAVGWETGDRIVSINGREISDFQEVIIEALLNGDGSAEVVLEREEEDGDAVRYVSIITPTLHEGEKVPRFGIAPFRSALIRQVIEGSPAERAGLKADDIIRRANGDVVDTGTFTDLTGSMSEGGELVLDMERPGEGLITLTVSPERSSRFEDDELILTPILDGLPPEERAKAEGMPVRVAAITEERSVETGLKAKDIVTRIDGVPATAATVRELQRTRAGDTVKVSVNRPAIGWGLMRGESNFETELTLTPTGAIGVALGEHLVFHRVPPGQVFSEAMRESKQALALTLRTILALFEGQVGADDLGGPLMIQQITSSYAQMGFTHLLVITAFISINLAVFNLLPLPVLDGGQLVFLLVEAVRRKPIDVRILERIQQFGMVFILFLIIFVTFNDVRRIVENVVP